ncbi:MAG: hypothetical protein EBT13_12920 [Rhodobacteraceae bacterium]|nr:hypothetical protein [Paracoccaceae bacterium]
MTNDSRIKIIAQDVYIDRTASALVEIYGERWAVNAQHETDGSGWSRAHCLSTKNNPPKWRKTAGKIAEQFGAWMVGL